MEKKMSKRLMVWLILLQLALIWACSEQRREEVEVKTTSAPVVLVTNYPLQYFVERIATDAVEVRFPARDAGDPAYWQPSPEAISALQEADLILLNGASYEQWLANVTLPPSKLIDTSEGFEDRLIASEETVTHSHGPEGEHEHQGTAFTTWLDLDLAARQAGAVCSSLASILPARKKDFEDQLAVLEKDLLALDTEVKRTVALSPQTKVFFSHPVYQYLEKRYGVQGMNVHWEPDVVPDAAMWKEFRHLQEHHPAAWMIWEAEPLPETVEKLRTLGVESVVFAPCGNAPEEGDFLSVMRGNISSLGKVFD
jgi:zinc transport system substrate-binding protein